jgi:hypothetical protein
VIAYEFYFREKNRDRLIGILPERRRNLARITDESIMGWARRLLGEQMDMSSIFFVRVTLSESETKAS